MLPFPEYTGGAREMASRESRSWFSHAPVESPPLEGGLTPVTCFSWMKMEYHFCDQVTEDHDLRLASTLWLFLSVFSHGENERGL